MPKLIRSEKANCNSTLRKEIFKFFTLAPNPTDEQIHSFAEKLGIDYEKLEEVIYEMFTEMLDRCSPDMQSPVNEKYLGKEVIHSSPREDQEDKFLDFLFENLRRLKGGSVNNFEVNRPQPNELTVVFDFDGDIIRRSLPKLIDKALHYSGLKFNRMNTLRKGNAIGFKAELK